MACDSHMGHFLCKIQLRCHQASSRFPQISVPTCLPTTSSDVEFHTWNWAARNKLKTTCLHSGWSPRANWLRFAADSTNPGHSHTLTLSTDYIPILSALCQIFSISEAALFHKMHPEVQNILTRESNPVMTVLHGHKSVSVWFARTLQFNTDLIRKEKR